MPAVITVKAKAGGEGRLFGSVTTADIATAVQAQTGIELDRRKLHLDDAIKSRRACTTSRSGCTATWSSRSASTSSPADRPVACLPVPAGRLFMIGSTFWAEPARSPPHSRPVSRYSPQLSRDPGGPTTEGIDHA